MTTKFTKGPWAAEFDNSITERVYIVSEDSYICKIASNKYDAALIACAPEMYEMLETILQVFEMDHRTTTDVISLLEKARGEK